MRVASPEEVSSIVHSLMDGFASPWCVAGGWALDLFLGGVSRPHSDLELAVFRQDQLRLRLHFHRWTFTVRVDGRSEAWLSEVVLELPLHEIHASSPDDDRSIEFLLNERDAENWVFRRDRAVTLSLDHAIVASPFGVPVLSPEIVLLFKAKAPRPKDESDFATAVPRMTHSRRSWLRSALLTCDPDNPWIRKLDT